MVLSGHFDSTTLAAVVSEEYTNNLYFYSSSLMEFNRLIVDVKDEGDDRC